MIGDAFSGDSLWRKISIDTAYILGEPILLRVSTGAQLASILSDCRSFPEVYLTIIPRARVGYEMIDSQRGA